MPGRLVGLKPRQTEGMRRRRALTGPCSDQGIAMASRRHDHLSTRASRNARRYARLRPRAGLQTRLAAFRPPFPIRIPSTAAGRLRFAAPSRLNGRRRRLQRRGGSGPAAIRADRFPARPGAAGHGLPRRWRDQGFVGPRDRRLRHVALGASSRACRPAFMAPAEKEAPGSSGRPGRPPGSASQKSAGRPLGQPGARAGRGSRHPQAHARPPRWGSPRFST